MFENPLKSGFGANSKQKHQNTYNKELYKTVIWDFLNIVFLIIISKNVFLTDIKSKILRIKKTPVYLLEKQVWTTHMLNLKFRHLFGVL